MGPFESYLRGIGPDAAAVQFYEDLFWFVLEVAWIHRMDEDYLDLRGVDADVLSYAIEAAQALGV